MNKEIHCKACSVLFEPKSPKNIFHNRKCYKKYFYHQKKAEGLANIRFPIFGCPNCGTRTQLDFDPTAKCSKWLKFVCPNCNTLTINVCEYILTEDERI